MCCGWSTQLEAVMLLPSTRIEDLVVCTPLKGDMPEYLASFERPKNTLLPSLELSITVICSEDSPYIKLSYVCMTVYK